MLPTARVVSLKGEAVRVLLVFFGGGECGGGQERHVRWGGRILSIEYQSHKTHSEPLFYSSEVSP